MSGKRAQPPVSDLSHTESESGTSSTSSPSVTDYATGSHSGVDMQSSLSEGSKLPEWSKVSSTPGGTDVSLDSESEVKPGTTTEDQLASSSNTKSKSVSWGHSTAYPTGPDDTGVALHPPVALEPGTTTEIQPSSSNNAKGVSWGYKKKVYLVGPEDTPVMLHPPVPLGPVTTTEHQLASSSDSKSVSFGHTTKVIIPEDEVPLKFPPPKPPTPNSNGFFSNFKSFFSKLGNFRPRFQPERVVDTRA